MGVRPAGPGLMGTLMWPEHHLPHQTGKERTSSKRTKPARGKIDADSESDRVTGARRRVVSARTLGEYCLGL